MFLILIHFSCRCKVVVGFCVWAKTIDSNTALDHSLSFCIVFR